MRNTRYFRIKEGKFFAPCPKDDNSPDVQDGRIVREWTNKAGEHGTTVGYQQTVIDGLIEYMKEVEGNDGMEIQIGVQEQDGVSVLVLNKKDNYHNLNHNVRAVALRHDAIDLNKPVRFSIFLGNPTPRGIGNLG